MAILAMTGHGQDARGTSEGPEALARGQTPFGPTSVAAPPRYPLLACASCSSFNVFPFASFQSVRPLEGLPNTKADAIEGELNV
jgi:hypothetical protein